MNGRIDITKERLRGSALILTVVLTSILAIVGIMFVMASRVEMLSTSAMTDERDLNLAVDTIVAKLANELVLDVPGVAGQEYYDYPGEEDTWLANIEPYSVADVNTIIHYWGQITDLTGYIRDRWGTSTGVTQEVNVDPPDRDVIKEYPEITLDQNGEIEKQLADADGDGIADSRWIKLEDLTTSKAKSIYAAIRVIDNAGMLNVNTAYMPDENDIDRCDGRWLHQINLAALGQGDQERNNGKDGADAIFSVRSNIGAAPSDSDLEDYELDGAWRLTDPNDEYTPFDISDELELRHRNIVSAPGVTRIETTWEDTVSRKGNKYVADRPYDARKTTWNLDAWLQRIMDPYDPNQEYDRRHILTTYSIDRIISANANGPVFAGMTNVNLDVSSLDDVNNYYDELLSWEKAKSLYERFTACVDVNRTSTRQRMKRELAQLAVSSKPSLTRHPIS